MLSPDALRETRAFLEWRLLAALERRAIAYWGDVTATLTEALCDLGRHRGYAVAVERPYPGLPDGTGRMRSDVHWGGPGDHLWEIDRTVKADSAAKLRASRERERTWVLWARDNDLLSLRLLDLEGVNLLILGHDVRKLAWERLVAERMQRMGWQALAGKDRFAAARRLDADIRGGHPAPVESTDDAQARPGGVSPAGP